MRLNEGGYVHKGDHVQVVEVNGVREVRVIPKKQVTAIAKSLSQHPESYGFKGDVKDLKAVKEWAHGATSDVIVANPEIGSMIGPDGKVPEIVHTTDGKWFVQEKASSVIKAAKKAIPVPSPAPHDPSSLTPSHAPTAAPTPSPTPAPTPEATPIPEVSIPATSESVSSLLHSYPAKSHGNIIDGLQDAMLADERIQNMSPDLQDKVLKHLLEDNYLSQVSKPDFYKKMGITSGSIFDLNPGAIKLDGNLGKGVDMFTDAIKAAMKDTSTDAKNLWDRADDVATYLKFLSPEDLKNPKVIAIALEKIK